MPVIYCFLRSEGCVKSRSKLARFFLPHKADQSVWRRPHARIRSADPACANTEIFLQDTRMASRLAGGNI